MSVHIDPVLPDLCKILLRFRIQSIAIFADIEKVFLQVGIQKADRVVTHFLWFRDLTNLDVLTRAQSPLSYFLDMKELLIY